MPQAPASAGTPPPTSSPCLQEPRPFTWDTARAPHDRVGEPCKANVQQRGGRPRLGHPGLSLQAGRNRRAERACGLWRRLVGSRPPLRGVHPERPRLWCTARPGLESPCKTSSPAPLELNFRSSALEPVSGLSRPLASLRPGPHGDVVNSSTAACLTRAGSGDALPGSRGRR